MKYNCSKNILGLQFNQSLKLRVVVVVIISSKHGHKTEEKKHVRINEKLCYP